MDTCTWAPTVFQGSQVAGGGVVEQHDDPYGADLRNRAGGYARHVESLGISHLLIAQRWWGSGVEVEASSFDCLAMTSYFASCTEKLRLVTAIHPGFFHPTAIAKWGASLDALTEGRWAINVVSGWNLREFEMYGVDALTHDTRYARTSEFIDVLRGAWSGKPLTYNGEYYQTDALELRPKPRHPLTFFQGGQSDAALAMAGAQSDWMFLNGGTPEKIAKLIERANAEAAKHGRKLRFAMYAAPLCRETDDQAWAEIDARLGAIDGELLAKRKGQVSGAQGMWTGDDPLSHLDTNEGYCARLIGSPETILTQVETFRDIGVDMMHLDLSDARFKAEVLPAIVAM